MHVLKRSKWTAIKLLRRRSRGDKVGEESEERERGGEGGEGARGWGWVGGGGEAHMRAAVTPTRAGKHTLARTNKHTKLIKCRVQGLAQGGTRCRNSLELHTPHPHPVTPPPPPHPTPPFSGQPQESINNIDLLRANNKHTHTNTHRVEDLHRGGKWK